MKNLFKKMHFGALTFVVALGIIVSQSAFTGKRIAPNYYQDVAGNWHALGSLVPGSPGTPNTYQCDENFEVLCTAYFPSTPSQNQQPAPSDEREDGKITIN